MRFLIGMGIGLAASAALSRVLNSYLFGITATDAGTYVAVVCLMVLVVIPACGVPAHRAMRVDPVEALRWD